MKTRAVVFIALLVAACAHAELDRAKPRGAHEAGVGASEVPVRGFAVDVTGDLDSVSGELIAVDPTFVYVNVADDPNQVKTVHIPRAKIRAVYVQVRSSAATGLGIWTALGCTSTLSHGAFLIFSGPIWLATGIPSSVGEGVDSKAEAVSGNLDQLYQYARFPQGLPTSWGGAPRIVPSAAQSAVPATSSSASGAPAVEPVPPPRAVSSAVPESTLAPPTAAPSASTAPPTSAFPPAP